jgi:hypothetical protein
MTLSSIFCIEANEVFRIDYSGSQDLLATECQKLGGERRCPLRREALGDLQARFVSIPYFCIISM